MKFETARNQFPSGSLGLSEGQQGETWQLGLNEGKQGKTWVTWCKWG